MSLFGMFTSLPQTQYFSQLARCSGPSDYLKRRSKCPFFKQGDARDVVLDMHNETMLSSSHRALRHSPFVSKSS